MIAKEGRIILIPLFLITFPIGIYAHAVASIPLTIMYGLLGFFFLFCLNFFRDPKRVPPMGENLIISPADGKVVKVTEINDPEVGETAKLVSIFLNVFNVHANRVPLDGIVTKVEKNRVNSWQLLITKHLMKMNRLLLFWNIYRENTRLSKLLV